MILPMIIFSIMLIERNITLNKITLLQCTAVEQAVACTPVTQRARVRSPVGSSFLGETFSRFFLTCKTNVKKL